MSSLIGTHTFVNHHPLEVIPLGLILLLRQQKKHYDKRELLMLRDTFVQNVESSHKVLHGVKQDRNMWRTFRKLLHLPVKDIKRKSR